MLTYSSLWLNLFFSFAILSSHPTNKTKQKQGLSVFPKELYDVVPYDEADGRAGHCLMLRSHKLQEEEVSPAVRAIARCGAGTNNIPVGRMTELGIPVFNTPGANANAVKGTYFEVLLSLVSYEKYHHFVIPFCWIELNP